MESEENLIELRNVNLTYNQGKSNAFQSLFDVNINVKKEEFVVILGPSGCGKSSLLNIIAGLEKPDNGTVFINGVDILRMKPSERTDFHRSKVGMIFQAYNLISTLSVLDNVALPQIFTNKKRKERESKVMLILERLGIKEHWKKIPVQLSGGQQQRIGIARSIVNNPALILADEPVGNLDSQSANNVMQIISDLNRKEGKTVLMVTHNPENVAWATHIIYMKDGKVIKEEWKNVDDVSEEKVSYVEENKSKFDKFVDKFRGLSEEQISFLLSPLKAKIIAESFLIPYEEQQVKVIEEDIRLRLSGSCDAAKFFERLDSPMEKDGAGLDERTARKFGLGLEELIDVARKASSDISSQEKAKYIFSYLSKNKEMNIKEEHVEKVILLIEKRITNKIYYNDFKKMLDLPENLGGAGLDKRVVRNILREIDLIMIASFGIV